jgi:hypothetical protein
LKRKLQMQQQASTSSEPQAYRLYFINMWHVYVSPKTYTWSGTFIINLLVPEFYI